MELTADCANCKKNYDGDAENNYTEIETSLATKETESSVIKVSDALTRIYEINWNSLFAHLCHEVDKKFRNEEESFQVSLCSKCANLLVQLYKSFLDFESLLHQDSLIKKAKDFRFKTDSKSCIGESISHSQENRQSSDDEVFNSFLFDNDLHADSDEEAEEKFHPETETRGPIPIPVEINSGTGPPGKRLVIKLEKLKDSELPKSGDRQRKSIPRRSKSTKKIKYHENSSENKVIKCPECNKEFTNYQNLRKHSWMHRPDRFMPCEICGKVLGSQTGMRQHRKAHLRNRLHKCKICGKEMTRMASLLIHHRRIHISEMEKDGQRKPCEICGKVILIEYYDKHFLTHTKPKEKFPCDKCPKLFLSKEKLQLHLEAHESTFIFKCPQCAKEFLLQKYLDEHIERHHNIEKPHACDKCPMRYKHKCHLETHKLTHTANRPFVCEECGSTFRSRAHLNKHIKSHKDEKLGPEAFKCSQCGKCLRNRSSLYDHTVRFHRSDLLQTKKIFECTICGRRLFDGKNLKKHYAAVHKCYPP